MMQDGGNAFDAAAAASFVLSVVQPHLSGLGGDFFGLFYEGATGRVHCLNGSGWSPASSSLEKTLSNHGHVPRFGHASVVVPGCVQGVYSMHKKFGRLPFAKTVARAIGLADGGFPVGTGVLVSLSRLKGELPPSVHRTFMPSGQVPSVGSVLRQRQLAVTLREIAERGADGFYRGRPAEAIIREMSSGGAEFDHSDFSSFTAEWCEPLRSTYRGTEVFEVPPNSMGATTLLILKLLEGADLSSLGANSGGRVAAMVEAARQAYGARDRELGDPRFSRFRLEDFLLSGKESGNQARMDKADTTYFSVADEEGNLLSCIQSIFFNFGSRVFVEDGGFFLNNRGSAFSIRGPNRLEPRKRPLHTLSALILSKGGEPIVATGASGGEFRPQQHALFATNIVDYGMGVEQALDYPRFLWDGDEVIVEKGYGDLSGSGLKIRQVGYPGPTGVAQGVQVLEKAVKGVCDVRGEGFPAGE